MWPLQIEIDLHNLPTAVSDRDRQNSRSKTLLLPHPLAVCCAALLQCCNAAALGAVKAGEMDGTCHGSPNRAAARFHSGLDVGLVSNTVTVYAVEG